MRRSTTAGAAPRSNTGDESLADYAQRLGITSNNATVRLHRARKAALGQLCYVRHARLSRLLVRCLGRALPLIRPPLGAAGEHAGA